jgi:hypothetical protein
MFNSGNRNLRLLGNLVLDSVVNDGGLEPLSSKLTIDSLDMHYIILKNRKGINTFDVDLKYGDVFVSREGNKVTSATNMTVQNTLQFGNGSILALGDSTNLIITNSAQDALLNYSKDQFVRTSHHSGMLIRNLSTAGAPKEYIYPVGSFENGTENYTPLILNIQTGSGNARLGTRVSPGDKGGFPGGHFYLRNSVKARYLKRFWMIDSVAGSFEGMGRFHYVQNDVYGTEDEYNRIGRWRPNNERYPGNWDVWEYPVVDKDLNYFETINNFSSDEFTGDWTLGNPYAFMRIFYSRQTGLWNDPTSWTENETHTGPIFGVSEWPDGTTDSVVIGGGDGIVPAHEISMTGNVIVKGTTLGTGTLNRGTLNTANYTVLGRTFNMSDDSHLKISSKDGISLMGLNTGSIQSSSVRNFSSKGIYEYNGNMNQVIGNGLPPTINSLITSNTGPLGNNTVLVDRNIDITNNLAINSGTLDIQNYNLNNNTGIGSMSVATDARLRLGGDNNLLTSVNNYSIYNFDENSFTEFYGDAVNSQTISLIPGNLLNGLGNVDLTNSGTKIVDGTLLIRGNLSNNSPGQLNINYAKLIMVKKNVINSTLLKNYGIIEIGE